MSNYKVLPIFLNAASDGGCHGDTVGLIVVGLRRYCGSGEARVTTKEEEAVLATRGEDGGVEGGKAAAACQF